jgi:hypothetical protein
LIVKSQALQSTSSDGCNFLNRLSSLILSFLHLLILPNPHLFAYTLLSSTFTYLLTSPGALISTLLVSLRLLWSAQHRRILLKIYADVIDPRIDFLTGLLGTEYRPYVLKVFKILAKAGVTQLPMI